MHKECCAPGGARANLQDALQSVRVPEDQQRKKMNTPPMAEGNPQKAKQQELDDVTLLEEELLAKLKEVINLIQHEPRHISSKAG